MIPTRQLVSTEFSPWVLFSFMSLMEYVHKHVLELSATIRGFFFNLRFQKQMIILLFFTFNSRNICFFFLSTHYYVCALICSLCECWVIVLHRSIFGLNTNPNFVFFFSFLTEEAITPGHEFMHIPSDSLHWARSTIIPTSVIVYEPLFGHRWAFIVECLRSAGELMIAGCEVTLALYIWTVFSFPAAPDREQTHPAFPKIISEYTHTTFQRNE